MIVGCARIHAILTLYLLISHQMPTSISPAGDINMVEPNMSSADHIVHTSLCSISNPHLSHVIQGQFILVHDKNVFMRNINHIDCDK